MSKPLEAESCEAVSFELSYIDKKGRLHTIKQPKYKTMTFNILVMNDKPKGDK